MTELGALQCLGEEITLLYIMVKKCSHSIRYIIALIKSRNDSIV